MTYTEFIFLRLKNYETGQPIYTSDIAAKLADAYGLNQKEAVAATAVVFKRMMDEKKISNLRFHQKGIYYFTVVTPFGEAGIDTERLIADKYLLPDIGYETGYTMLHRMGLTTQLPNQRCIATNKATDCTRTDYKLNVIIRPPKTTINEENKAYLQFLDVLDLMDKAPIDAIHPYKVLTNYIHQMKLKYELLLSLADKYYSKKTILQLAHTASEGDIQ